METKKIRNQTIYRMSSGIFTLNYTLPVRVYHFNYFFVIYYLQKVNKVWLSGSISLKTALQADGRVASLLITWTTLSAKLAFMFEPVNLDKFICWTLRFSRILRHSQASSEMCSKPCSLYCQSSIASKVPGALVLSSSHAN